VVTSAKFLQNALSDGFHHIFIHQPELHTLYNFMIMASESQQAMPLPFCGTELNIVRFYVPLDTKWIILDINRTDRFKVNWVRCNRAKMVVVEGV